MDRHDAVVIGSGLAGLTAAATIAREGLDVVLLEQADIVGGYAHGFRRGPYTFHPAVHSISEVEPGAPIDFVFRHLGILDRVEFVPRDSFFDVRFPGFTGTIPTGLDRIVRVLAEWFPESAREITTFTDLCARVHHEAHELPTQLSLGDLDWAAARYPALFESHRKTVGDVLGELGIEGRVASALGASWPYLSVPPSLLSFLTFAQVLIVWGNSVYLPRGGFQSIVSALEATAEGSAAKIIRGARATRILVEDDRVAGVEVDDGRRFRTSHVVANGAARRMLLELVGEQQLPTSYVRRLKQLEPSVSAFGLFATSDADLVARGVEHETLIFHDWDHDVCFRAIREGRPGAAIVHVPTVTDPSLAPEGEHVITVVACAPFSVERGWAAEKERYTEELLGLIASRMPELAGSLQVVDVATPDAYERYALNEQGAMSGWATIPSQSGSRRLAPRTPVEGLFLAGQWTHPGSGSIRCIVSGFVAAQMVLEGAGLAAPRLPLPVDTGWSSG